MKKQRFSTEQIVAVLKQAEMGLPVKDLIRQVGTTEQTFYRWKRQYEPALVRVDPRGQAADRGLEEGLQRYPPSLGSWQLNPGQISCWTRNLACHGRGRPSRKLTLGPDHHPQALQGVNALTIRTDHTMWAGQLQRHSSRPCRNPAFRLSKRKDPAAAKEEAPVCSISDAPRRPMRLPTAYCSSRPEKVWRYD